MHMDARGLVTSTMGAILSLFFWNGNGFHWKRTLGILLASMFTGGYTITVMHVWIAEPAFAHLANMGVGYLASDLLSSIKSQAPTITKAVIEWCLRKGRQLLGIDAPPPPPTSPPTL